MKRTNVQERGCEISRITKEKAQTVYSMDEWAKLTKETMPLPYYFTIESENDWDIIQYYTNKPKNNVEIFGEGKETVYVMHNPSHPDLLFKIGETSGDPEVRRKQLSKSTGVPEDFELIYIFKCNNSRRLEKAVHKALREHRHTTNKEFFMVDLDTIKETIQTLGKII